MKLRPLENRRIVVPESRELDLFARMLEGHGATTVRCPMVTILDVEDAAPVVAWLERLVANRMDDLILLTGEGLRRLIAIARNRSIDRLVIAALGRMRTVTRGPKPARALREIGLAPSLAARTPTSEGVIEILSAEPLAGRSVGVQLYPGATNPALLNFLHNAGAAADPVLPYRYASDAASSQVEAVIVEMAAGRIDAIAFTSSPQVARLRDVARDRNLEDALRQGLARTRIAAVGPVVATAVEAIGGHVSTTPDSFHLKPLVAAICAAFAHENSR
jgi:uroporphyrinogen-III synthase